MGGSIPFFSSLPFFVLKYPSEHVNSLTEIAEYSYPPSSRSGKGEMSKCIK